MPAVTVITLRQGTAAAWTSANPVLALGEPGLETDTNKLKFGDGATAYNSLPYFAGSGLSSTLTSAHLFVGNGSNVATDVAVSGDLTLANTGAFTLNTVNSNVGTFTSATITVNAKGLITAASSGGGGSELVLLATGTASSSATLDFTSLISSSYSTYIFVTDTITLSNGGGGAVLDLSASTDNGSTWTAAASWHQDSIQIGSSSAPTRSGGTTPVPLGAGTGNALNYNMTLTVGTKGTLEVVSSDGPNNHFYKTYAALAASVTAIRFSPDSGNITSGDIYMYGIKNT